MRHKLINKGLWKNFDWPTLILICVIFLVGLVTIVNVTAAPFTGEESAGDILDKLELSYALWQLVFFSVGLVMIFVMTFIDYHVIIPYIKWLYLICLGLLTAVLFFGSTQRGTTGWFMIGTRGFQPGEICKIIIILVVAKAVSRETENSPNGITELRQLLPALVLVAVPVLLIMAQPDFGTACVYIIIFLAVIFVARTSWRVLGMLLLMAAVLLPIIWFGLADWQRMRIFTFLDPNYENSDAGLQVAQAQMAIGSGGLWGKGLFAAGSLSQLGYVPEQHNDFIFSVTVETFGFVGGILILGLYIALIVHTFMLAMRAKDDFGSFIIIGVGAMLLFHVFENVGMNLGILPVTGIPLPFFSYGGSNLVTNMIAYGMALSVDMRRGRWKTL